MRVPIDVNRHEVNCLTKEEFERSSRSGALTRQGSQIQSPLSSSSSIGTTLQPASIADVNAARGSEFEAPDSNGDKLASETSARAKNESGGNRALALMVQPSIDYGK